MVFNGFHNSKTIETIGFDGFHRDVSKCLDLNLSTFSLFPKRKRISCNNKLWKWFLRHQKKMKRLPSGKTMILKISIGRNLSTFGLYSFHFYIFYPTIEIEYFWKSIFSWLWIIGKVTIWKYLFSMLAREIQFEKVFPIFFHACDFISQLVNSIFTFSLSDIRTSNVF